VKKIADQTVGMPKLAANMATTLSESDLPTKIGAAMARSMKGTFGFKMFVATTPAGEPQNISVTGSA
jgi:hypothetical protein